MSDVEPILAEVAASARAVADRHGQRLTSDDHASLTAAFYRAESLAESALVEAIEQLDEPFVGELREQLEDERRHVAVFASWYEEPPPPVRAPKVRRRPEAVWFTMLLLNEVTGYCQFHMLAALVGDASRQREVEAVARDETRHIARLVRWLAPYRAKPAWSDVMVMVGKFVERLPGRMGQFLPRPDLEDLRTEMAETIRAAITRLLPPAKPTLTPDS